MVINYESAISRSCLSRPQLHTIESSGTKSLGQLRDTPLTDLFQQLSVRDDVIATPRAQSDHFVRGRVGSVAVLQNPAVSPQPKGCCHPDEWTGRRHLME